MLYKVCITKCNNDFNSYLNLVKNIYIYIFPYRYLKFTIYKPVT